MKIYYREPVKVLYCITRGMPDSSQYRIIFLLRDSFENAKTLSCGWIPYILLAYSFISAMMAGGIVIALLLLSVFGAPVRFLYSVLLTLMVFALKSKSASVSASISAFVKQNLKKLTAILVVPAVLCIIRVTEYP